jgi:hypothetical protein
MPRRARWMPMVVLIAAVVLLSGCGEGSAPETANAPIGAEARTAEPDGDTEALEQRIAVLEAEAREARKTARDTKRREGERERREREAQPAETPPEPSTSGGGITVPDVTGLDHQAAQDALQGEGLWSLDEKDASGQGRLLLFDRNWEVVRTDPAAGSHVTEDTTITIYSKKQGE